MRMSVERPVSRDDCRMQACKHVMRFVYVLVAEQDPNMTALLPT